MYSLLALFFIIPLYFSHVFSPFGLIIGEVSSFERQKVYLFIILLGIACIEGVIRFPGRIRDVMKQYGNIFGILVILPIFATFYFYGTLDMTFFFGSYEKHHGYLFYVSIIGFIILMMASPVEFLRRYLVWSMYSTLLVACIAIGERIGGIYDIYGRSEMLSMYPGRSSSTLGNPNYVAGYLLPFIPIYIEYIKKSTANIGYTIAMLFGLMFVFVGIVVTGSYIAIGIVCLILLWYNIVYIFRSHDLLRKVCIFLVCVGIFCFFGFFLLDSEKLLSLMSRWVLMQESIRMILQSPLSILIGFGPESIMSYFSGTRSILIDQYFPQNMIIDSSHNIFIDILFQYGILPIVAIGASIYRKIGSYQNPFILSIISIIVFFLLNVVVLSHILIFILFMCLITRDNPPFSQKH